MSAFSPMVSFFSMRTSPRHLCVHILRFDVWSRRRIASQSSRSQCSQRLFTFLSSRISEPGQAVASDGRPACQSARSQVRLLGICFATLVSFHPNGCSFDSELHPFILLSFPGLPFSLCNVFCQQYRSLSPLLGSCHSFSINGSHRCML